MFLSCQLVLGSLFVTACGEVEYEADATASLGSTRQALSLGSALGVPVVTGSTCGMCNCVNPGCTSSNASDMSYDWTAPSSGTYTFTTNGSNFDTVLVIAPYTNPASRLACKNSVSGTGGESVSLSLSAGQRIIITIDGYASLCGSFKLNITKNCSSCTSTACRTASCSIDGVCQYSNSPSGTPCDDFNACTSGDACNGSGFCVSSPLPSGTSCNDGLSCTSGDMCDGHGGCAGSDACGPNSSCTETGCVNPCSPYGNYEYCGVDTCCVWGSNCTICI